MYRTVTWLAIMSPSFVSPVELLRTNLLIFPKIARTPTNYNQKIAMNHGAGLSMRAKNHGGC
jgi:hypothetical protein